MSKDADVVYYIILCSPYSLQSIHKACTVYNNIMEIIECHYDLYINAYTVSCYLYIQCATDALYISTIEGTTLA